MTKLLIVKAQLQSLGLIYRFHGKAEVKELANILKVGELVRHCILGFYQGGSALLVATDSRLLLIDKRTFYMNLEDIRYGSIKDVNFSGRLLDASVEICTNNNKLIFRSFADARLNGLCGFVQEKISGAEQEVKIKKPTVALWKTYTILHRRRVGKFLVSAEN